MPRISTQRPPRLSTSAALRLASIDFDLANAARRVIEGALGVVPGEHVYLLVDKGRRDVGGALLEAVRSVAAHPIIHELESHGERPVRQLPDAVRAAIGRAQASVMLVGFDDAEVGMRLGLLDEVRAQRLRHAHMVGVSRRAMIAGFSVDPSRILDATRAVRTRLRPDSTLRYRTPGGTDLEVQLDPQVRTVEYVGVIRPGRWENLPAGKIALTPARVRGVFVADASIGGQAGEQAGLLDKTPLRLEIDGGVCRRVTCPDRSLQREVEAFLAREPHLNRVGLVTLGTNVGIAAPVGELVCDQNGPGLHVAFGSSSPESSGGAFRTRLQLPMAGTGGDLELDGVPLLRSGRYMVP